MRRMSPILARMARRLPRELLVWRQGHKPQIEQAILLLLGILAGLMAGGAEILFRLTYRWFQYLSLGFSSDFIVSVASEQPWWRLMLGPALAGAVIGLFVQRFMPKQRPQAVSEVILAAAQRNGGIPLGVGVKAALVNAASIGAGASVGREGPMVHLGAALASSLTRLFRLSAARTRTLLGCGVAAGVAASFNAPIAGVFFALEVVVGNYRLHAFAPIVIASVTGTTLSRLYYGHLPAFEISKAYAMASVWEFPAFAILGVASALVAMAFMAGMIRAAALVARSGLPVWLRAALAGLAVGAAAAAGLPHILGVGYEVMDQALAEAYGVELLLALLVAKMLATILCLSSGFGGGVFSPSLYIGAMLGGAFGIGVTTMFPALASSHGAYTIVGMGAVAGSVLGAPISTILIVFEMTGNYELTIAVMVGTVIASVITSNLCAPSLFHWQLDCRGADLPGDETESLLRERRIARLVEGSPPTVRPEDSISELSRRLDSSPIGEVYVVAPDGRLLGVVSWREMPQNPYAPAASTADAMAQSVMRHNPPTLAQDDDLSEAARTFSDVGQGQLPVVESKACGRLVGTVRAASVIGAYRDVLARVQREEHGEA